MIDPTIVKNIDQFLEGSLGFHVRTERGIPVCSRTENELGMGFGFGFVFGDMDEGGFASIGGTGPVGCGGGTGAEEGGGVLGGGVDIWLMPCSTV